MGFCTAKKELYGGTIFAATITPDLLEQAMYCARRGSLDLASSLEMANRRQTPTEMPSQQCTDAPRALCDLQGLCPRKSWSTEWCQPSFPLISCPDIDPSEHGIPTTESKLSKGWKDRGRREHAERAVSRGRQSQIRGQTCLCEGLHVRAKNCGRGGTLQGVSVRVEFPSDRHSTVLRFRRWRLQQAAQKTRRLCMAIRIHRVEDVGQLYEFERMVNERDAAPLYVHMSTLDLATASWRQGLLTKFIAMPTFKGADQYAGRIASLIWTVVSSMDGPNVGEIFVPKRGETQDAHKRKDAHLRSAGPRWHVVGIHIGVIQETDDRGRGGLGPQSSAACLLGRLKDPPVDNSIQDGKLSIASSRIPGCVTFEKGGTRSKRRTLMEMLRDVDTAIETHPMYICVFVFVRCCLSPPLETKASTEHEEGMRIQAVLGHANIHGGLLACIGTVGKTARDAQSICKNVFQIISRLHIPSPDRADQQSGPEDQGQWT
ncbi:hypothetical protein BDK51DRAFT_28693 [Blyttiomyces helicus]|uniref:Uncharacterized protein n=1 Tax=Blyttiomyces helicus TaxID=388810 RepID=A0A4P9WCT5_9FUNG|nr:hypothetical protein BDK51DRAFT_28693 [Blyttiomyces helicus]|eukprot:RKO90142.1 hypothetical protein BDK51DRAFT_28693 [Blyttiomyces helicus]